MDFLTKFVSKHSENPKVFTLAHTLAGCTSNFVAGSDMTAISLSAILYYLLRHPETLGKLREEVDGMGPGYVTFKDSQGMGYLQTVIKEALRMHPATGLPLERVVPAGGATIAGRFFPQGVSGNGSDPFRLLGWRINQAFRLSLASIAGWSTAIRPSLARTPTRSGLSGGSPTLVYEPSLVPVSTSLIPFVPYHMPPCLHCAFCCSLGSVREPV